MTDHCPGCGEYKLGCICEDYDSEPLDDVVYETFLPEPPEFPVYNCRLCGEYKCDGH